ncbi:MAG: hypothetical protein IKP31_04800 [Lachnospiraceae bacterium]|nr:hypothetical protein [Lachnospiraceae bacterium]
MAFRFIDAADEYREIISRLCDAYESFCRNIDVFYKKLLIAKKQFDDSKAGLISDEDIKIDLSLTFELDMDPVIQALETLNEEDDSEEDSEDTEIYDVDWENDFEDTEIYKDEDLDLSVKFCGFEVDDSDNTIQFMIWVSNHADEERHFWLKNVVLDGKTIVNITSMGNVDANDSDYLTKWMDVDDFTGEKKLSFCIEIDNEIDEELDNSQVVNCVINFDTGVFRFNGLEEYRTYDEDYDDEDDFW